MTAKSEHAELVERLNEILNRDGGGAKAVTVRADLLREALAALQSRAPSGAVGEVVAFGHGNLGVDTGTAYERPAVFIRPLDHSGPIGGLMPDDKQIKGRVQLEPGEFCLTFPTMEQAERVADALANALPLPDAGSPVSPSGGAVVELAREMLAGMEGVTPGPWNVEYGESGNGPDRHPYALLMRTDDEWPTGIETSDVHCIEGSRIMEHIARCSPENIALLCRAALSRHSAGREVSGAMVERAHGIVWPATEWNEGEHACRQVVRLALEAALSPDKEGRS